MDDLLGKIAAICILVLLIVIIMTVVQNREKKKLLKENERLQEIIEVRNSQVREMAAQNKVFGETLKKTLVDENEVIKSVETGNETGNSSDKKTINESSNSAVGKEKYLNLVLDLERLSCEKNDIDFRVNINACCDKLPFSETDLVRLFCNLLDNAIEAAGGRKDAYINFTISNFEDETYNSQLPEKNTNEPITHEPNAQVTIKNRGTCLEILVENSKDSLLKPLENGFSTTKEEKDIHGRGVGIIKEIVGKYNGKISWEDLDDRFITKIII